MKKTDLWEIRDYLPSDEAFLVQTWSKGYRYGYFAEDFFKEIPIELYFDKYRKIIDLILKAPSTKVNIACLKDDTDVVLGYSVFDVSRETILHWVFVKSVWRDIGVARSLLPKDIKVCTHLTKQGCGLKRKWELTYDPFWSVR